VLGFEEAGAGVPRVLAVESSQRAETAASAIRIAAPAHASEVEQALERASGTIMKVSDDALLEAWRALAQEEGVFCEPASAAGVAGLAQAGLAPGTRVVCVITGHGLKDPEAVERLTPPPLRVDPDPDAIAAVA
jgi:threonine synthase